MSEGNRPRVGLKVRVELRPDDIDSMNGTKRIKGILDNSCAGIGPKRRRRNAFEGQSELARDGGLGRGVDGLNLIRVISGVNISASGGDLTDTHVRIVTHYVRVVNSHHSQVSEQTTLERDLPLAAISVRPLADLDGASGNRSNTGKGGDGVLKIGGINIEGKVTRRLSTPAQLEGARARDDSVSTTEVKTEFLNFLDNSNLVATVVN
mmetsp:Transcript_14282/g.26223  ORF Transcript_14282/g.26223 Transcript_14282/m.26223 type:complete len:208 (+) Transcript_14282:20335-20958(+)